jgi:hypothetical protein
MPNKISIRTVMTRHPWAIGLMESRRTPGPATRLAFGTPEETSELAKALLLQFPTKE